MSDQPGHERLLQVPAAEMARLRVRLAEAEETLEAIRNGEVDTLVIRHPAGPRLYSLEGVERVYRTLIETMPEAALTLTLEGVITYCNRSFACLARVPLDQCIGRHLTDFLPRAQHASLAALLAAPSRSASRLMFTLQASDDRQIPVRASTSRLEGEASAPLCIVITDLTELEDSAHLLKEVRRQREEAEQSRLLLRSFFDSSPLLMGLVECDDERTFLIEENCALAEFRQVQTGAVPRVSQGPLGWTASLDRQWLDALLACQQGGAPARFELHLPGVDAQTCLSVTAVWLGQRPNGRCWFSFSAEDVTERRRMEQRKNEFLATLAHELRNPLAPLRTGLEILHQAGEDAHARRQALAMMDRQFAHLVQLVDDLLDLGRITTGRIVLQCEAVAVADCLQQAVEMVRPLIDARRHRLELTLAPVPLVVEADPLRLTQILANLLTNAAKYTLPGGHIRVSVTREAQEVAVAVADDGLGIPAALLPRIFEMFVQDPSLVEGQSGLGIGLHLVRRLVDMQGGRVAVQSAGRGQGSRFVVHLPLAQSDADRAAPPGGAERPGPRARRQRILIIDDNQDAADSLGMLLTLLGHETRVVYDGLSGLDLGVEFRPEVVLLDLGMPTLDGYATAERMRAEAWGRNLSLIALTGWGQEEDRRRTRMAGFNQHLMKPVEIDALTDLLAAL